MGACLLICTLLLSSFVQVKQAYANPLLYTGVTVASVIAVVSVTNPDLIPYVSLAVTSLVTNAFTYVSKEQVIAAATKLKQQAEALGIATTTWFNNGVVTLTSQLKSLISAFTKSFTQPVSIDIDNSSIPKQLWNADYVVSTPNSPYRSYYVKPYHIANQLLKDFPADTKYIFTFGNQHPQAGYTFATIYILPSSNSMSYTKVSTGTYGDSGKLTFTNPTTYRKFLFTLNADTEPYNGLNPNYIGVNYMANNGTWVEQTGQAFNTTPQTSVSSIMDLCSWYSSDLVVTGLTPIKYNIKVPSPTKTATDDQIDNNLNSYAVGTNFTLNQTADITSASPSNQNRPIGAVLTDDKGVIPQNGNPISGAPVINPVNDIPVNPDGTPTPPNRGDFEDGFEGTLKYLISKLIYYVTLPLAWLAFAMTLFISTITSKFGWFADFSNLMGQFLAFVPEPIMTIITLTFIVGLVGVIVAIIRGR